MTDKQKRLVDLHIHSCHSDGLHTPVELVRRAKTRGLAAIAIADHDAVEGIDEALEAGSQYGIEVIPAVELSVELDEYRDVHVLGYLIDHHDQLFRKQLALFRSRREERGRLIVKRINEQLAAEHHEPIRYEEAVATAEGALGRPHIARLLLAKGIVRTMQDAFLRYLGPCDVPKEYFPFDKALKEIRRIGGVSVLAHPPSISQDREILGTVIRGLVERGLDGIEVFNNMCYKEDSLFLAGLAAETGLISTGGSDFHGGDSDTEIGSLRNGLKVSYECVEKLKDRQSRRILSAT
ncbi:PHP domain-containing protein [Geobacter sp. DSM 9736]|uniref:PHP domain-containing protein n=1 Tax=Geobacter sp. DSM 9736 TaxID=1277350 RepID=UPI000B50F124|nr:PHP domain-containing protein [Geobacter sp. DSM 9736]SNB45724.1 hypothetical protein SAMN06269301_1152 [Geobacter sp. DSM 9736]